MKGKNLKGMFTVEAALLLPMIMIILAAMIIAAFYMHDAAVLQSVSCEIAAVGTHQLTEETSRKAVESLEKSINGSILLGSRNLQGESSVSMDFFLANPMVTSSWSADYPVPGLMAGYFAGGSLHISKGRSYKKINPSRTIWVLNNTISTIAKIKDVVTDDS